MKILKLTFAALVFTMLSCNSPMEQLYTADNATNIINSLSQKDATLFKEAIQLFPNEHLEKQTVAQILQEYHSLIETSVTEALSLQKIYPTLFLYRTPQAQIQGKFSQMVENKNVDYTIDLQIKNEFKAYESAPIQLVDAALKSTQDQVTVYGYKTLFTYTLKPETGETKSGTLLGYRLVNQTNEQTVITNSGQGMNEFIYIPQLGNDDAKNRLIKNWTNGNRLVNGAENNKQFAIYCEEALKQLQII